MTDHRRHRVGLRVRMVLLAAAVVALILVLGGLLLAIGMRGLLTRDAIDAGRVRARDLAVLAADGSLPPIVPIRGGEEALVQVVAGGQVLGASSNLQVEGPVDVPLPAPGEERQTVIEDRRLGDDDRFRLISLGIDTPQGPGAVHVAISLTEIHETVGAALATGAAVAPVLLLLVSAALWVVVGRTLQPIEAIRREAEAIGGDDLGRRVPEPPQRDEVGRLARTVNGMLGRIQDSAQRQRRFVGDAAHELRTPVASLRTQLETARGARGRPDWPAVSADLLDEVLRMQRVIEQLLLLARLDATSMAGRMVAVDLDDIVVGLAHDLGEGPGRCMVDVAAVTPVQLQGEPTLLAQAVRNLLDNARRHAATTVRVGLCRDGDTAVLTVDDDGRGVPAAHRPTVFARFTRHDEGRGRDHGGAGLGLAIVADIVAAHHGTVSVDDAPDLGGARFEVRLPA